MGREDEGRVMDSEKEREGGEWMGGREVKEKRVKKGGGWWWKRDGGSSGDSMGGMEVGMEPLTVNLCTVLELNLWLWRNNGGELHRNELHDLLIHSQSYAALKHSLNETHARMVLSSPQHHGPVGDRHGVDKS